MADLFKPLPDPDQIRKFFETWWGAVSAAFATIAGLLLALRVSSPMAYGIAAMVTAAGLVAFIVLYRREAKRRKMQPTRIEVAAVSEASAARAFRGLRRFRRGEKLPGPQRRRDAAQLLAEVIRPDFRIAVVTGDSGAGKSSLLECALVEALEKAGHPVVMISNPSRFAPSGQAAGGPPDIGPVLAAIDEQVKLKPADSGKPLVLILDQFEELLSRFRSGNELARLGDHLRSVMSSGTRIVIGMRKEYLAEFKEVATRLAPFGVARRHLHDFQFRRLRSHRGDPGVRRLGRHRGGSGAGRPDRPRPCRRRDGTAGRSPGRLLRAVGSTEHGAVQERRRSRGIALALHQDGHRYHRGRRPHPDGAAGALRHPEQQESPRADDGRGHRGAGARRSARPPRHDGGGHVRARGLGAGPRGRRPRRHGTRRWSLIHDYLVEPIKLATEEQTSRSEQATARLAYFVARSRIVPRSTIPLVELQVIRRDAPPVALKQRAAQRLIRRSLWIGYGKPLGLLVGAALASSIIFVAVATERRQWRVGEYGEPLGRGSRAILDPNKGRPDPF